MRRNAQRNALRHTQGLGLFLSEGLLRVPVFP